MALVGRSLRVPRTPALCSVHSHALSTSSRRVHLKEPPALLSKIFTSTRCRPLWRATTIPHRHYQNLAKKPPEGEQQPQPKAPQAGPTQFDPEDVSLKEQRRRDWTLLRQLMQHVWPKGDWEVKSRVVLSMGLLVGSKVRSKCIS